MSGAVKKVAAKSQDSSARADHESLGRHIHKKAARLEELADLERQRDEKIAEAMEEFFEKSRVSSHAQQGDGARGYGNGPAGLQHARYDFNLR